MSDPYAASITATQALNAIWSSRNRGLRHVASGVNRGALTHRPAAYAPVAVYNLTAAAPDSLRTGLTAVSGSLSLGFDSLSDVGNLLDAMQAAAQQALAAQDRKARANYQQQFNAMLSQIEMRLSNALLNGVTLAPGPQALAKSAPTAANPRARATLNGVGVNAASLGVAKANWSSPSAIQADIGTIDIALQRIRATVASYTPPVSSVEPYQVNPATAALAQPPGKLSSTQVTLAQQVVNLARQHNGEHAAVVPVNNYVSPVATTLSLNQ